MISQLEDVDKAKFNDITYHSFYKMFQFLEDTTVMKKIIEKAENEWEEVLSIYPQKVDSVIEYWIDYKRNNSLNEYVKIEFKEIVKEYYTLSPSTVKNMKFGFRLCPLQGEIDEIKFTYSYSIKNKERIADNNCVYQSPFKEPVSLYCEIDHSKMEYLENTTTDSFLKDYDIDFEITDVKKDGIDYSLTDLNIPQSIKLFFKAESDNPSKSHYTEYSVVREFFKEQIIKELLCSYYLNKDDYVDSKTEEALMKEYPLEFAYIKFIAEQ